MAVNRTKLINQLMSFDTIFRSLFTISLAIYHNAFAFLFNMFFFKYLYNLSSQLIPNSLFSIRTFIILLE